LPVLRFTAVDLAVSASTADGFAFLFDLLSSLDMATVEADCFPAGMTPQGTHTLPLMTTLYLLKSFETLE
jgi:hypothetical protein